MPNSLELGCACQTKSPSRHPNVTTPSIGTTREIQNGLQWFSKPKSKTGQHLGITGGQVTAGHRNGRCLRCSVRHDRAAITALLEVDAPLRASMRQRAQRSSPAARTIATIGGAQAVTQNQNLSRNWNVAIVFFDWPLTIEVRMSE